MKTYSFKINGTKKNNKKNTGSIKSSFSKIFDSILASNIIKANPYFIDDIINPTDTIIIGKTKDDHTTFIDIDNDDHSDYGEFLAAMKYLANKSNYKDTYDYELSDGTPVKIFDDEIQIGYDLIPIKRYSYAAFESLKPKTKKTIIDIYIKLNH